MGCDIHCYIEYKTKDSDNWSDFGGRINPGRNYWMFGAMSGTRTEHIPFIQPRGVPDDLAYSAWVDWSIYVSDRQVEDFVNEGGEYYYSRQHAEASVAKGYCQWIPHNDLPQQWVTNSDWHTPSWLTSDEFELAMAAYLKASGFMVNTPRLPAPSEMSALATEGNEEKSYALSSLTEYWAILQAMRCFEAQGHQSRLVFWFDN